MPGGVLNIAVDFDGESTEELVNDIRISGIIATGSGDRLENLMFIQYNNDLKFINEIKGMNPAIIYKPYSMESTVNDIIHLRSSILGNVFIHALRLLLQRKTKKDS